MQNDEFKPREMSDYEGRVAEFVSAMNWTCEEGMALAGFTYAALNASAAMKKRFGFKSPEEFRAWCNEMPGGEAIDYPFPSAQTNSALKACIAHIDSCQICRMATDFNPDEFAGLLN